MSPDWTVHPNRSQLGPNAPGRNGHFRTAHAKRVVLPIETCRAQITLPLRLSTLADGDGTATFSGPDWAFVVGVARSFARQHLGPEVPPPFGYRDGRVWFWWDGTRTTDSILDRVDADEHVRRYLNRMFPNATITISDSR